MIANSGEYCFYSVRREAQSNSLQLLLEKYKNRNLLEKCIVDEKIILPDSFHSYSDLKLIPFSDGGIGTWQENCGNGFTFENINY